jgi:hypothetical protein
VVRNIYGFELETERLTELVERYPFVWQQFRSETQNFILWLRALAEQLEDSP